MNPPGRAPHPSTLLDLLTQRASETPEQRLYTFLDDAGGEEAALTYAGLELRARRIAAALQQVAAPGERVMLLYPPGLEYVAGFFGCLYAGLIAVPAYPPDPTRLGRTLPRLQAIIGDAQAKVVLTTSFIASMGQLLFEQAPDLQALHWLATDELAQGTEDAWRRPGVASDTLAFLQYTSGSTGTPKGVMLSHSNLLNNLELISHAFQARGDSVGVIWLPPYHDMGLIGGILEPLYEGMHTVLMSPLSFLKTPLRWLEAVSRFGGTISGGPNFAFDLCVRRISPEERATLDLSRWEVAFCGAEPIRVDTLERFVEAFGPHGFRREAFYPCYGLAEGTLIASGGPQGRAPLHLAMDAAALERNQVASAQQGKASHLLVSCGQSLPGHELLVVEPTSRTRHAEGTVGEIWLAGPSVAQGYWQRPEETSTTFLAHTAEGQGPFLRTGDLGVFRDGELFVTGRLKDLIIIRGRNHYPQDIELTVEKSHPALRPGCVAAFAVEEAGEERLVVVHEVDVRKLREPIESLVATVRQRVAELHEVQLHALVLLEPGSISKTSSGKIQRRACRTGFLEGSLQVVHAWRTSETTESTPVTAATPEDLSTREGIESWLLGWLSARLRVAREKLSVTEPLTRFGLDSLASVELSHELETTLGMRLPMQLLLQGPSIAELASQLLAHRTEASSASSSQPSRHSRQGELPLSFAQQRLWVLDQLAPGSPLYNIPAAVRLEGTLDVSALKRSFEEIVRRHESLRTTFRSTEQDAVQIIDPQVSLSLPVIDSSELPRAEQEVQVARLVGEEAQRPFELARGPLFRVKLLRLGETQHVLVLTMHHIVSDGWSMGILIREVTALYRAFTSGQSSSLPELPVQYADFAAWQRQWLQGEALETQLSYWRQQLAQAPKLLELPTDRPRPPVRSYRGAQLPVLLPATLSRAVHALSQREGATPFMVLLAGFQALLSRYSGQQDISVGSPIAGRTHAGTEGLIGFFVNTLVLRTHLEGNPSFRELLGRVRQVALGAYAHQDLPFEKLVEELKPERSSSYSPLFQVMLALRQDPLPELALPGITTARELAVDTLTSKFDLSLSLVDTAQGFTGSLEYNTDLFEAGTAARMLGHLQVLLEAATANPELPLSALPLLSEAESQQVLVEWNATQADFPRDTCVHTLVEAQALRTPEALAVQLGQQSLTYRQLDARANQLAWHLRSLGVRRGALAGVCLPRSPDMVVALLAILKAGAAYVPLDPAYPLERLSFMLRDAGVSVLLTHTGIADKLPSQGEQRFRMDSDWDGLAAHPAQAPDSSTTADDIAYVIYTSGSTGLPKGVQIPHRGLMNLVTWHQRTYSVTPADRATQLAGVAFDASVWELWPYLTAGASLHLPSEDIRVMPSRLVQWLASERITLSFLPTPLAEAVLQESWPQDMALRVLLTGGDRLSRRPPQGLRTQLVNHYGPTESTVVTSCDLVAPEGQEPGLPPIGRPISNTRVYLLDRNLRPVGVGVPGELYIGGDGLAVGYLRRPELTAERFIPNPFGQQPGARLYRTGDRARFLPDGRLEYLERVDFQVKVRGFRIELGEVDAALAQHASVQDVVTLAREDVPGDKRLVAYLVARSGQHLDPSELRSFLQQRLPEYMVPSAFVSLESLPLTSNGKVDRKALPAPDADSTGRASHFVEPSNPLEQQLVALWSRVLGTERIGVHDHFFQELGGTSLSAVKVVTRMREELQREIPATWIFEHPTIHALARRLAPEASPAPAHRDPPPQAHAQGRQLAESGTGDIAIIGVSGRFPGARSVESFWHNLRQGLESISRFSPEELERMPRLPEGMDLRQHPQFVPAGGVLEAIERFDHSFFDIPLREAQWMDPQQRLFLQCAWAALEDAGYVPERTEAPISLYAGAGDSGYLQAVMRTVQQHDPATLFDMAGTTTHTSLATKVSYKLGLTGESLMVQTACSTGLVAVHMACKSLLTGQSDIALAGAARIEVPQRTGYVYQEGMIASPDGHCRAFDARAQGTVGGNGVIVVALKRLAEAVRDGDHVYAVIKGSAINNDGRIKSGFTAPSVQGQATVIQKALANAGLKPTDIGYVEAHGTGTRLGDPIEIAALQRAYGLGAEHRATIPIGSVKTNIGHLDNAAGLAGLLKATLALHHEELPPSLHFERPNPAIDFDAGPFFVNATLRPWKRGAVPRRAAVSSFGVGGTNAHAVLEEAPPRRSEPSPRPHQLVLLSARTPGALEEQTRQLAAHVESHPTLNLADLAFTLAVGRKDFEHRRALVVRDTSELMQRLRQPPAAVKVENVAAARQRRVAFLFPGQGAQQVGMGRELYESEPTFRQHVDTCLGLLEESLRAEVLTLLRPAAGQEKDAARLLTDTRVALPALFTVEYALARLWMSWGVRPHAVLGHSYGEYVAACLSGVLSLEDGLRLAVARGRLMSQLPPGAMLAVGLPEAELRPLLPAGVSLAALNAPDRCVISGPTAEVERFAEVLKQREVGMMRLPAPHAFHSADVEPLMPELAGVVASLKRSAPSLRYVSSLTGTWASAEQVAAPGYWADQMRQPVRFASGVQTLLREGCSVILEVGPGQDLTGLVRACLGEDRDKVKALPSLRRAAGSTSEHSVLLRSVGEVWAQGLEVDWTAFHAEERRLRLSLPTYPFEEQRCWVEGTPATREAPALPAPAPTAHTVPASAIPTPAPALPTPAPTAATAAAAPQALPIGEIEERVAALWRERLGVEHVGRDDDFLELGGNSLMAAQLLSRLRDTFGVQVPLGDLFEAPTVARLAQRIEALLRSTQKEQTRQLSLAPQPRTGELALSYVQERVWRAEQYLPGLSAYNMPFVLRLEGPLRAELFERSIQELVQRHEILRTTYEEVDGRPVQRFHASMHVPLEVLVLSGTREEREAEAMRLAREDAARPFDLVKGPVMRTTLVRLHEDVHVLLCNIHHIASDTLSCVFFIHELGQTYNALRQGLPSPLAPLPFQYADFGHWQKRALAEGFLTEQQQWWRQQLAGMPRQLDLPTDRPRPSSCAFTSRRVPVDFPRALATELAAFSTREGVTSFMTLLAAWQTLLHRYSGQSDIVVATPIANRSHPELQPLMGYVAQSVALRTDLGGDPTFRELLGRVREVVSGAYAHPDVPFEQLLEELFPERKTGQWRLGDSVCILHGGTGDQANSELGGMRATLVEVPDTPVQWGATLADLALVLTQEHGRVHGALEYATELFDEARVLRMMEHLWVLLGAAMARPEERLSRLPLLTEAERREWEAPRPTALAVPTVPERLAARVVRHPEAVATVQGEREWTWTELSARAEHLASRLRALGVKPGVAVGVCLKPSPEKLVALWGVLRAGGATVALGPTDLSGLAAYAPPGAAVPLLLTWRGLTTSARLEPSRILYMEELELPETSPAASTRPGPEDLACILPTTGTRPAWTLTHRGLERLFESMDERLRPAEGGAWVAATESTAERPELELLWALSRGLRVVFPAERLAANLVHLRAGGPRSRPVDLSLSYFADDEDSLRGPKYELLLEGAKFADTHGFSAVWTPERHFNSFGGLYPQPGVISAALAAHTRNLQLRAGSVVLPLHDPILVAEQWSVVDNLSQGRVGISVASGWHTHDFAYAPDNYKERRAILMRNLQTVRELWRGKRLERRGGDGQMVEVGLRPRPVQRELPVWLTAASNPETFRLAGEIGAGVLTNLMAHDLAELATKVALYREAWRRHGHQGRGHITLMLHTFIGTDEQQVLKTVREPLMRYLRSSLEVVDTLLASQGLLNRKKDLTEQDITAILEHGLERYVYQAGLIGTRESGLKRLKALREVDVDEVACLIDFGLETGTVLEGLRHLAGLREQLEQEAGEQREQMLAEGERGVEELLELARRDGTAVLQATAWLARRVAELPRAEEALRPLQTVVVEGGSAELAAALRQAAGVEVLLSSHAGEDSLLPRAPGESLPPGQKAWVLDEAGQPVPQGVVGELALSGAGLPQGLWRAEEEERRRLVPHPLEPRERLYRTGRRARLRADGSVEKMTTPVATSPRPAPAPAPAAAPRTSSEPPALVRVPRTQPLPLSFAQQRLWYVQELEPSSVAYNNSSVLRLSGPLDVTALQAALNELVRRHEVLRTTYSLTAQGAVQVIHPPQGIPLAMVELHGTSAEERKAELLRLCEAQLLEPFNLERGPVLRALLVREQPQEHVLCLAIHHIVSDAWSALLVVNELMALHNAFAAGRPSPLPELPLQYADFAAWQRKWLEGPVMEAQLGWWKQQLADIPPLELPLDRPRPATQSFAGDAHRFRIPKAISEPLLAIGRREGATSFMVVMALYQALLHRHSGQESFAVGMPMAGRNRPETEGLIGCFINTLALPANLSNQPSFRQLLGRVRQTALGVYAHQEVPFERMVEVLRLPRDLSRTPVFQVVLNLINTPMTRSEDQALRLSRVEVPTHTAKVDLTLEVWERDEGLDCTFEFASALFAPATISRMAGRMAALAEAAVASPDLPIALLPILTAAESQQMLVEWNATQADFPRDTCVHTLVEAQALRAPDALAVQLGQQSLTYRQLDARANQLAWYLRSLGVRRGALVGVCLPRSPDMVVALLAILKAGAAYVPLDPSYPLERLSFMLRDAGISVLLTQTGIADALPSQGEQRFRMDSDWDSLAAHPAQAPDSSTTADDIAYVIYTSGSTGLPKGVQIPHRGLMNLVTWHQRTYAVTPSDRATQLAGVAFDASVWELWPYLTAGASLHLPSEDIRSTPSELVRWLASQKITLGFLPTPLAEAVLQEPWPQDMALRVLLTGGDRLSRRPPRGLRTQLVNHYGPTESTVVTSCDLVAPEGQEPGLPPIGRPISNTRVYLLDRNLRPVGVGVPGELYIGGDGLAVGYLRRPELTAERFIPNPFSQQPGARLYRTGDRARFLPDGRLEYLERVDFQVKVRGFRIELGEIEEALVRHPTVKQAVVVMREDVPGDKRLVAYAVPQPGLKLDALELRKYLQGKLPEYMVPSALVGLESLPLTSNGKVDRKALPALDGQLAVREHGFVAPRTPTEETLANLWKQVLNVERVGIHDNFFELGGHSLLVTQAASRIRASFGVELPLRSLFEAPTVEALASRIDAASHEGQELKRPPLEPIARTGGELPLSFAQQRMWFLEQLEPGLPTYNVAGSVLLEGTLDVSALERGFQELVRRHESLRTTFRSTEKEPVQVIHPEASLPLPVIELGELSQSDLEAEVRRLTREEAGRPFNLTHGPLLRVKLLKLGETRHVLLLTMHHIVSDGWSMGILIREVGALYQAFSSGQPSPLPELPVQYADYAAWQRQWLRDEALESQLSYWREQLAGAPQVLELPTDRPRPAVQTYRGTSHSVLLPAALSRAVTTLGQQEGATPFMVLLAAFQAVLSRYSGQQDISVGSPIAGRTHADTEGLIGFFVNTLVLRTRLEGNLSFRELLGRVRQTTLGAYAHQDLPFEKLVEELKPQRSLSHSPLFQVMFAFHNAPASELSPRELTLRPLEPESQTARFDLTLSLSETPEGLVGALEYNTDLFEPATAARMMGHLRVLLEAATSNPELPLASLPLLSEAERQQVLVQWNDTRADYPRESCIHHLFEAQVERTPDATALVCGEVRLSYRELNARSNRLARYLRSLGVGPEVRVGICMERNEHLLTGLLAILKAGGTYVPLDPAYPRERLAFMLEDASGSVLLTQSHLVDALPLSSSSPLRLDSDAHLFASEDSSNLPASATPDNLAYLIYTSGSTGRPKGVALQHRSAVVFLHWALQVFSPEELAGTLAATSVCFDLSVFELFAPLSCGGSVLMARDALHLAELSAASEVTLVNTVPSAMAHLVRLGAVPPSVRTVNLAGEALSASLVREVYQSSSVQRLYNLYGPSEDTTYSTFALMRQEEAFPPIGKPLSNTQAYVLDASLQPVPIGVPGELYLSGLGLARGYLGRPELTAERFLPNPFSSEGGRMYRTGDKVRLLSDGTLEYLGRLDSQVKVRGFRIELGEVDAVLAQHASVQDAVTLAREDVPGDKRLVAYLVARSGQHLEASELRSFLKQRLPEYMVPSAFVPLEALPLTSNGKVDRKALPAPEQGRLAAPDIVPPRNDMEAALVQVWEELLGVKPIGVHNNFFELGGHSLLATQIVSRVRRDFGVALPLRQLFKDPTVANLAELIVTAQAGQMSPEELELLMAELETEEAGNE